MEEITRKLGEEPRCQRCGVALAGQALGELCANCLLGLALAPADEVHAASDTAIVEVNRIRYFGDYELIEEIARGGMGVVFKARQVSLNRSVALKMILAGGFSSPTMVERFRTEAEAAARLEHPNIVPIYEIGAQAGQHYFSMRYLDGGTLAERIKKRQDISSENATPFVADTHGLKASAELMLKVARAVHHAHQRGILHRDLKPGNILFDRADEPMVADFGLAKLLEESSSLTVSATVLGTPSYMAPEQATGHSNQLTTSADVYSLGVILYELLTGHPPFRGTSPAEILRQVIQVEPRNPRAANPGVGRDLETICLKCLEKNPQRRYGSAEALADDLQRWLAQEPIQARRTTVTERVVKWGRRKPAVASLVLALHLVVVAGVIGIVAQSRRANKLADRATTEAANARSEFSRAEKELWNANLNAARAIRVAGGTGARFRSSALLQELIRRPDLSENQILELRQEAISQIALADIAIPSNWTVHSGGRPLAWDSQLRRYARGVGGGRIELREYPSDRVLAVFSTERAVGLDDLEIGANDQFLAALFVDGELRVWNLATRELIIRDSGVRRLQFSPDGRTLMTLPRRGLALHPIARPGEKRVLHAERRLSRIIFSPDSRHLCVLPEGARSVEVWDMDSGEVLGKIESDFPPERIAWHPHGTTLALGGDRGRLDLLSLTIQSNATIQTGPARPLTGHMGAIRTVKFSEDGSTLFSFGWPETSIAWDLVSGRPHIVEPAEFNAISSDATRVAFTSEQTNAVATWVQPTGFRVAAYAGEPREAHGVWVSADGRLAVASYDSVITGTEGDCIVWDFDRGHEIARLKGVDAVFSKDSQALFTFERYGANRIRRYDVSPKTLANRPPGWSAGSLFYRGGRGESINSGTMAPDGRTLIVAASDAVLFVDTLGVRPIRSWRKPAHSANVSEDGKWVATSFFKEPSVIRSVTDGTAVFRAPNDARIRLSAYGRWMATVDKTGVQMYPFDKVPSAPVDKLPLTAIYTNQIAEPGSFAFSPDNRIFAVVANRTLVRLYDISTGRELATLTPPRLAPISGGRALTFSPDGQWLLAAKHDGEVVAWNLPMLRRELAGFRLDWKDSP